MHVDLKKLNRLRHRRWAGVGTDAFNLAIIGLRLRVPVNALRASRNGWLTRVGLNSALISAALQGSYGRRGVQLYTWSQSLLT